MLMLNVVEIDCLSEIIKILFHGIIYVNDYE